jgi:murein DD-endopeptidase MepM/ murein hydrolase activator NlpD
MRTIALVVCCVCVILGAVVLMNMQTPRVVTPTESQPLVHSKTNPATGQPSPDSSRSSPTVKSNDSETSDRASSAPGANTITDADLNYLATRNLLIPVAGVTPKQLHDTFSESRSEGRQHQALDIPAPQGTVVLATTDGSVIKLFQSEKGGITLYELDPSGRYVYYYAHLMRYADGIEEKKQLRRGEVIGFVGDSGNAGAGNYHLHFAISKVTSPAKWSGGEAINPFPFLTRSQ